MMQVWTSWRATGAWCNKSLQARTALRLLQHSRQLFSDNTMTQSSHQSISTEPLNAHEAVQHLIQELKNVKINNHSKVGLQERRCCWFEHTHIYRSGIWAAHWKCVCVSFPYKTWFGFVFNTNEVSLITLMSRNATKTHQIIISFLNGRNHYHTSFDLLSLHAAVGHTLCFHEASQSAVWPRRRLFFVFLLSHADTLPSAGAPNGGESKRSNWLHCVSALAQGLVFHRGGEEIKEPWEGGAKERNKPIKTLF